MAISSSGLFLVANLLSNFIVGAYIPVAIDCTRIFIRRYRDTRSVNKILLGSFILITLIAVIKSVVGNVVTVRAFVYLAPDGQALYPTFDSPTMILLNVLWVMHTFIADSFIVYRAWVIWRSNYKVVLFPALLTLACLGAGGYYIWVLDYEGDHTDLTVYFAQRFFILKLFVSMTLALNLICTALIAYRVWSVRREMRAVNMSTLSSVTGISRGWNQVDNAVAVIAESALIYTMVLTVELVLLATNSLASYVLTPVISYIIALVFGTIIVRSAKGLAVEETVPSFMDSDISRTAPRFASNLRADDNGIQVVLNRIVTSRVDPDERSVRNQSKAI